MKSISKRFDVWDAPLSDIHLVEASAGTGKTWSIVALYIRLLLEKKIPENDRLIHVLPKHILVVTFTEAATQELRERIIHRIQEVHRILEAGYTGSDPFLQECLKKYGGQAELLSHLAQCKESFDEAAIFTIHGFSRKTLSEFSYEAGISGEIEINTDESQLLQEALEDFYRRFINQTGRHADGLLASMLSEFYTKDKLKKDIRLFLRQPGIRMLLPSTPGRWQGLGIPEMCRDLREFASAVKKKWIAEREVIRAELVEARVKNTNYEEKFDIWETFLIWFLDDPVKNVGYKDIEKFTSDFIFSKEPKSGFARYPVSQIYAEISEMIALVSFLKDFVYRQSILEVKEIFEKSRRSEGVFIYEDLLTRLDETLERTPGFALRLREKYPVALIDEFQDTDKTQFSVFRQVYIDQTDRESSVLYLIGDPKQAIYRFRGADLNVYLEARNLTSSRFTLDRNYRSSANMVEAVNRFFDRPGSFLNPGMVYEPVNAEKEENPFFSELEKGTEVPALQLIAVSEDEFGNKNAASNRVIQWTCAHITSLLNSAKATKTGFREGESKIPLRPGDIAILVSSHWEGKKIKSGLRSLGIASVEYSDSNVFKSQEADWVRLMLQVIAEPGNDNLLRSFLCTRFGGFTLEALLRKEADETGWSTISDMVFKANAMTQNRGVMSGVRYFVNIFDVEKKMIVWNDGERHITNFRHLMELLNEEQQKRSRNLPSLIRWLKKRQASERNETETNRIRLESDENRVKIVTMHRSKGLEFPVVYAPFLWQAKVSSEKGAVIYYNSETMESQFDIGNAVFSEGHGKSVREELEDRLRLAYVTLTRAKYRCFVPFVQAGESWISPLSLITNGVDDISKIRDKKHSQTFSLNSHLESVFNKENDAVLYLDQTAYYRGTAGNEDDIQVQLQTHAFPEDKIGSLTVDKTITSYSSIQRRYKEEVDVFSTDTRMLPEDEDHPADLTEEESQESALAVEKSGVKSLTIFDFPKGADAGSCWHEIFENIDFQDNSTFLPVIRESCRKYGFNAGQWEGVLLEMVNNTLSMPLIPGIGLQMSKLERGSIVSEMEFMLPYDSTKLSRLMRNIGFLPEEVEQKLPEITGSGKDTRGNESNSTQTFLTGLIDLLFIWKGKYYILDYKSNYLGDSPRFYGSELVKQNMRESGYTLQYHLYVLALIRYLTSVNPTFDYDSDFGGVFYIYLRGVDSKGSLGIYFDKPHYEILKGAASQVDDNIDTTAGGMH